MPTYQVTSPEGQTVKLTGDSPPTEQELEDIFSKLPKPEKQTPQTLSTGQKIAKYGAMGVRMGGQIGGQIAGGIIGAGVAGVAATPETAGVGTIPAAVGGGLAGSRIGGAIGGGLSEIAGEFIEKEADIRKDYSPTEIGLSTAIGAVAPKPLAAGTSLAYAMGKRALQGGALTVGTMGARTALEEKRLPTVGETVKSLGIGVIGGSAFGAGESALMRMGTKAGATALEDVTKPPVLPSAENPNPKLDLPADNLHAAPITGMPAVGIFQRFQKLTSSVFNRTSWPAEGQIARSIPDSPIISATERIPSHITGQVNGVIQDTLQSLNKYSADDIAKMEEKAWNVFQSESKGAEGLTDAAEQSYRITAARQKAIASVPEDARAAMFTHWDDLGRAEDSALKRLAMPAQPKIAGPYMPRFVTEDLQETAYLRGVSGLGGDVSGTTGTFAAHRSDQFKTMAQGTAQGVNYVDPRHAMLLREYRGAKVLATANFLDKTEGTVLFREQEDALAAANAIGQKPMRVKGFPSGTVNWKVITAAGKQYFPDKASALDYMGKNGGTLAAMDNPTNYFWARSVAEGSYIEQNFAEKGSSKLGTYTSAMNSLMRNPQLVNPLPHATRNMGFMYALSGGNVTKLPFEAAEYLKHPDSSMVRRYLEVMPHTGQPSAQEILRDMDSNAIQQAVRLVGKASSTGSRMLFDNLDPAMKYSLWKQYVGKGLTDQQAANQVYVDMVRYGTRSQWVDMWKSIPGNFFVPWRVGVTSAIYNQLRTHPVRTTIIIGAADYMREALYRQTNNWIPMPHDYIEAPIAQAYHDFKTRPFLEASLRTIGSVGATAVFGPKGTTAANSIANTLQIMRDPNDLKRLGAMLWGLSSVGNVVTYAKAAEDALKAGDYKKAASALGNGFGAAALGEYKAISFSPARAMRDVPESVAPKSMDYKVNEQLKDKVDKRTQKAFENKQKHAMMDIGRTPDEYQKQQLRRSAGEYAPPMPQPDRLPEE